MTTTEAASGFHSYIAVLRRRSIYVATIAPIFTLLAVYFSFRITPQYQSTATILLEPSSLNNAVVANTVISYSNQQIEIVQGRVMTNETLKDLVKEYDPYPGTPLTTHEKAQKILEDTTLERVDPVTMKPLQESNAFSLHYRNSDPDRAAEIASRLAQLFLTYNQRSRQQAAKAAAVFLSKQADDVTQQIRAVDEELKTFKNQHGDALPEYVARNESSIDRDQHDLEGIQQEILRSEEKESMLAVQLSQTSPNLITNTGDLTDLATVRAKLAEAQERYTPDHPEVKRLKAALALLSSQQSSSGGIVANATNPTYVTVAGQLVSARRELAALKAQAAHYQAEIDQFEQMLRKTPGVEREYADITRRRQSLQNAYEQIQVKLQNATMAQNFETEEGGERFTLIRAPYPGHLPVYPNRIGLILLGLVLGLGSAGVAVVIAESSDSNIRDTGDFPVIGDAPVLASIPMISNSADRRRRRLVLTTWAAAYGLAIFVVGATVVTALHL